MDLGDSDFVICSSILCMKDLIFVVICGRFVDTLPSLDFTMYHCSCVCYFVLLIMIC